MNIESQLIEVLMKLLNHCPLKDEKLQFVGWVMGFSLGQTPASIDMMASVLSSWVW